MRHESKKLTKTAPPGPKGVANGVPGGAVPAPGVALGVTLVPVDESGVPIEVVVAVEEEGLLEVALPALVTVAVAVVAAATVPDIVFVISQKEKF